MSYPAIETELDELDKLGLNSIARFVGNPGKTAYNFVEKDF